MASNPGRPAAVDCWLSRQPDGGPARTPAWIGIPHENGCPTNWFIGSGIGKGTAVAIGHIPGALVGIGYAVARTAALIDGDGAVEETTSAVTALCCWAERKPEKP